MAPCDTRGDDDRNSFAMTQRGRSVVVGIDGSQAALDAATWAVAEADSLGVPLRLVHVSAAKRACRAPVHPVARDAELIASAHTALR